MRACRSIRSCAYPPVAGRCQLGALGRRSGCPAACPACPVPRDASVRPCSAARVRRCGRTSSGGSVQQPGAGRSMIDGDRPAGHGHRRRARANDNGHDQRSDAARVPGDQHSVPGWARIAAVRYAADDDCPAGCGHPEPAVLARRRWSGSECCVASESALDRFRLVWIVLRRVRGRTPALPPGYRPPVTQSRLPGR